MLVLEPVTGKLVSGEFFSVLGVRYALRRLFTPDDNRFLGQHPVTVISSIGSVASAENLACWAAYFR